MLLDIHLRKGTLTRFCGGLSRWFYVSALLFVVVRHSLLSIADLFLAKTYSQYVYTQNISPYACRSNPLSRFSLFPICLLRVLLLLCSRDHHNILSPQFLPAHDL